MYVMIYANGNGFLTEMTATAFRRAQVRDAHVGRYLPISAPQAHRHVKAGGTHDTPLYVDDAGRVRRASENS